jgi:hypothetical protein
MEFFWRKKQNEKIHEDFILDFVSLDDVEPFALLFFEEGRDKQ